MGGFRRRLLGSPTSPNKSGSSSQPSQSKKKASRIRRLADRLKGSSEDRFTPLAENDTSYNSNVAPELCEAEVSMKCLRRRRINIARKYLAVLDKGILELRNKKRSDVGLSNEYRIDLSKVSVLTDDTRIVLKFQVESLLLTPLDVPIDRWRTILNQHRMYSQAQHIRQLTTTTAGSNTSMMTTGSFGSEPGARNSEDSCNIELKKIVETLKDVCSLSIDVLDKANKTLEEAQKLTTEVRKIHAEIKATKKLNSPKKRGSADDSTRTAPDLTFDIDPCCEDSDGSKKNIDEISEEEAEELLKTSKSYNPEILFSLEDASVAMLESKRDKKSKKRSSENREKSLEALTPPMVAKTQMVSSAEPVEKSAPLTPISPAANQTQPNTPATKSPLPNQEKEKQIEKQEVVKTVPKRKRREILPSQQCQSEGIGLRVMYQMLTTRSGLPMTNYEPVGALQMLCEELQWSHLLDKACSMKAPEDRISMVMAFALSAYTNALGRNRKPFNPLMGETFEYEENGWKYHGEQVSHHPPISAAHAESPGWSWWTTLQVEMSISKLSKTCDLSTEFPVRLRLKTVDGEFEEYSWNKVNTKIESLTSAPEQRRVTHEGTMNVKCSNGYISRLHFKKGKQPNDVLGDVMAPNDVQCYRLYGQWDQKLYRQRTTGEVELMMDGSTIIRFPNHYGFTKFSMGLNEPVDGVPRTDSRLRHDMRWLETANTEKATQAKEYLEKVQRSNAKSNPSQSALWFTQSDDRFSQKKMYATNGRYWRSKEVGWKNIQGIPEIFSSSQ